jgi:hypothetical protein
VNVEHELVSWKMVPKKLVWNSGEGETFSKVRTRRKHTSLTSSLIAMYFNDSLIFIVLHTGPSARQKLLVANKVFPYLK